MWGCDNASPESLSTYVTRSALGWLPRAASSPRSPFFLLQGRLSPSSFYRKASGSYPNVCTPDQPFARCFARSGMGVGRRSRQSLVPEAGDAYRPVNAAGIASSLRRQGGADSTCIGSGRLGISTPASHGKHSRRSGEASGRGPPDGQ